MAGVVHLRYISDVPEIERRGAILLDIHGPHQLFPASAMIEELLGTFIGFQSPLFQSLSEEGFFVWTSTALACFPSCSFPLLQ